MPGDNDEVLDENEEAADDAEDTAGDDAGAGSEDAADKSKDAKADKRIADFQSKADAETARANKAEAALKAALAGKGTVDPVQQALIEELREASLDAVFAENPTLKQYSIDRSLIEGSTRAELRESAAAVVGLIKSVQTKVKNETLAEHGIEAPSSGAARKAPVDYGSMDDEAFTKLLNSM